MKFIQTLSANIHLPHVLWRLLQKHECDSFALLTKILWAEGKSAPYWMLIWLFRGLGQINPIALYMQVWVCGQRKKFLPAEGLSASLWGLAIYSHLCQKLRDILRRSRKAMLNSKLEDQVKSIKTCFCSGFQKLLSKLGLFWFFNLFYASVCNSDCSVNRQHHLRIINWEGCDGSGRGLM